MKKKVLALLLSAAMVFGLAACGQKDTPAPETTPAAPETEAETPEESSEAPETESEVADVTPAAAGTLVIGNSSENSGDYTPYWTNNGGDYDTFLACFSQPGTIEMRRNGQYDYNMTILAEEPTVTENEDGSQTYTFKLKEGLKWSNGDPITAKEYVLTPLLWCSPIATELGATDGVTTGERLDGFDEYNSGESATFKGLHLIDDYTFSVAADADYLPYYYGKVLVGTYPTYVKDWLPDDVEIEETEDGCKLSDNFTADTAKAKFDVARYTPTASCGPYMLVGYDQGATAYTWEINPEFPGDIEGNKPTVQTIIEKYTPQDTEMDQLKTGAVDILMGLADGKEIDEGLNMVEEGTHDYISYDRNGYGCLIFRCDRGPTQFAEVRQAVAYLLDRNEFAKTFTGGHGSVVNGPYGNAQWMADEAEEQMETLNSYNYSLDKAVEALEAGGWTLNKDGNEYAEGDGLRYKDVDGELMPLHLNWCSSENNSVADLLVTMLAENPDVATAGMEIEQEVMTFPELLQNYYGEKENDFNMYNMATNFSIPYDLKQQYALPNGDNWGGNNNHIADDQLAKYSAEMNTVEEGDDDTYVDIWFSFIQRWNELMPDVPLYSNVYHDFTTSRVKNWDRDDIWGMHYAITYVTIEE